MRALQLIEDRRLETVDLPPPPPPSLGEVTLRIKAVALNHIDVWGWRGMAFAKRKLPLVIGAEASGEVEAVGAGVSGLLPGQLVSIYGARTCGLCRACREGRDNLCEQVSGVHGFHLDGFAQERINLPARLLVAAPPGVTDIGAAVAPVTFGTVEHMLFDNARLQPGETILVHAGGSGIGSAAIQLARKMGCTVITTVGSNDKIDKARSLGADHVINYREDRFEGVVRKLTKKKGVDVVFEHVGADTFAASMLCLKRGGRLVTCGSTSGVSTQINLMQLFQQQLKLLGSFGCRMENMADAMQKMAAGLVFPVIDTEVGFGDIDAALKRMEGRDVFGKIILRVGWRMLGFKKLRRDLAFRHGSRLRQLERWLVAYVAMMMMSVLRLLPADRALSFADRVARRIGPWVGRHGVAVDNLRKAYPEKSDREIQAIASDMWGNMARLAAEYVFLDALFDYDPTATKPGRVEVRGIDHFVRIAGEQKPHIVFTGHLGNFELLPVAAATFGMNITALFRPPNNPYLAEYILSMRSSSMGSLLPSSTGASFALAAILEKGGNIGVLVDQKFSGGLKTTFFGRPCESNRVLGILARHYDCDVYPARCVRLPNNRFRLEIEDKLTLPRIDDGSIDVQGTTQLLNDVVERWVREDPGQWMWFHKRWEISGRRRRRRQWTRERGELA